MLSNRVTSRPAQGPVCECLCVCLCTSVDVWAVKARIKNRWGLCTVAGH